MTHTDGTAEPGGADEIAAAHDASAGGPFGQRTDAHGYARGMQPVQLDPTTVLRAARPGDEVGILAGIHALAEYEREPDAVHNTVEELTGTLFGPEPRAFAHVVERDGEIVGIAIWFLTYSTWTGRHGIWLEDLFVSRDHRGRGYGRALISSLARECIDRGYSRLEWTVLDWNEPAIGFYRSIGANPQAEWTTQRLTGDPLALLAAS